jgi:AcrR family transcriptional regulator
VEGIEMPERRRGAALEAALLDAAWEELAEKGYAGFTMDAVVRRARTSAPVLYRRWTDRDALVRAAVAHATDKTQLTVPDTGTLRGDLLELMREINETRVQFATVMSLRLAEYYRTTGTSPADLRDTLAEGRVSSRDIIYDRAVERGEIRPGRLTGRMKRLPFDLLRNELLMTLAPVPDETLEEIVDTLFLPLVKERG